MEALRCAALEISNAIGGNNTIEASARGSKEKKYALLAVIFRLRSAYFSLTSLLWLT